MVRVKVDDFQVPKKRLDKLHKNNEYNKTILLFYNQLLEKQVSAKEIGRIDSKIARMQLCNTIWCVDRWEQQKVKQLVGTKLCKDKFCNNCKKVRQAQRMRKFMPEVESVGKEANLSQMVLTVPNVTDDGDGKRLKQTIKAMYKAFATLIEYLKGKKKIQGYDFKQLIGYQGAIRSLEVTYRGDSYHPHLHVLLAHTQYLGGGKNINAYSHDKINGRKRREFTDIEILIQKIWKLLIDDIVEQDENGAGKKKRLNKKRIEELEIGYSCMIDKFKKDDFLELFKYMTKGDGKRDEDKKSSLMVYENFTTLFYGLNSVRQIQGYGCFFRIKDEEDIDEEEAKSLFEQVIEQLNKKESPKRIEETLQDIRKSDYTIISRKKVPAFLRQVNDDDR